MFCYQGDQNEVTIHYSTVREYKVNRSRRQRNSTKTECVYSSIKQSNCTCFIFVPVQKTNKGLLRISKQAQKLDWINFFFNLTLEEGHTILNKRINPTVPQLVDSHNTNIGLSGHVRPPERHLQIQQLSCIEVPVFHDCDTQYVMGLCLST